MPIEVEAYDATLAKLQGVLAEGERLLKAGSMDEVDVLFDTLRQYPKCEYCVRFRMSLEYRNVQGACANCPIHRWAERRMGRALPYNGCYRFPQYEEMVREAIHFSDTRSHSTGKIVLDRVKDVISLIVHNPKELK